MVHSIPTTVFIYIYYFSIKCWNLDCFNYNIFFNISELDDFLQELDEDVEGMQSTILFLQQELKISKETIGHLEGELVAFKKVAEPTEPQSASSPGNNSSDPSVITNGDRMHHGVITEKSSNGPSTISDQALETIQTDEDLSKTIASERTLRKERANSSTNVAAVSGKIVLQAPRTLRSSSRNISTEDLRAGKVSVRNLRNGNNEMYDDVLDEELLEEDDVEGDSCAAAGDLVLGQVHNGSLNRKRSHDGEESDSSIVPETDLSVTATDMSTNSLVVNHKKFTKRIRRTSVLSMDLNNEDDSRIDFDTERTLRETANGNGGIAEA